MSPADRTLDESLQWVARGTQLFLGALAEMSDLEFDEPSLLTTWSRRKLTAHVAANADAVANLVRWAATGVETPMYRSPAAREEGINKGVQMSTPQLLTWLRNSARSLDVSFAGLTNSQWDRQVRTAQGRWVPATETPWLRAREVCIHAVDLDRGVAFADLPAEFLTALVAEIMAKRGMCDLPAVAAAAPQAAVAAWLAGRPSSLTDAPVLEPWI